MMYAKLLGLDPEASEFSIVYGSVAANDKEIAILTRSVLEIITDLSSMSMSRPSMWSKSARFLLPRRRWPMVFPCRR
jgi:hypothetical protein